MEKKKTEKGMEALRFAVSGGICFLIELGLLALLKGKLGWDTLLATPVAFLVSVAVNYLLCVKWVFRGAEGGGAATQAGFLLTSVIGLGLNELLMLLFRVLLGEEQVLLRLGGYEISMYMLNKTLATLLVMIWNFFTKRAILSRKAKQNDQA